MRVLESTHSPFPAREAWDHLVASDQHGHLLQTWAWGELKGAFGWQPVRVAVEQDGVLVAGAQVLFRPIGPFSLGYIPKGPVLPYAGASTVATLWRGVHACARRMRAIVLKVEPAWRVEEHDLLGWLGEATWRPSQECIQPRRTIIVDLRQDDATLLARMKPKWRYNIRLSERKGVEMRVGKPEDLSTFHALMQVTGARDAFGIHSLAYYRRAFELFAPCGRVALLMAYHGATALAGLMAFAFNGQAWYMYGASANEQRELMPNHLLQWRAMQWARAQGCSHYDLWGIPDEDEDSPTAALEGVGRFKAGFGGEVVRHVGAYDHIYSRPLSWLLQRAWAYRRSRSGAGTPNSA